MSKDVMKWFYTEKLKREMREHQRRTQLLKDKVNKKEVKKKEVLKDKLFIP